MIVSSSGSTHHLGDPATTASARSARHLAALQLVGIDRLFRLVAPCQAPRGTHPDGRPTAGFRITSTAQGCGKAAIRVLIFAKAPVAGAAKTRLIPALGAEGAAAFHQALLVSTVARTCLAGVGSVELWCTPGTRHPCFAALARDWPIQCHRQHGCDLGERLQFAARAALGRADAVLLIGCDCPDLSSERIREAAAALAEQDAVMIPALDGGYVLLGVKEAPSALFAEMPWGSAQVAERTLAAMAKLDWRCCLLPALADIDRPEDLARLGSESAMFLKGGMLTV